MISIAPNNRMRFCLFGVVINGTMQDSIDCVQCMRAVTGCGVIFNYGACHFECLTAALKSSVEDQRTFVCPTCMETVSKKQHTDNEAIMQEIKQKQQVARLAIQHQRDELHKLTSEENHLREQYKGMIQSIYRA